jgi:hypothetical protein
MSKFDTSDKKIIETIFLNAKLEENWSLTAVAREL